MPQSRRVLTRADMKFCDTMHGEAKQSNYSEIEAGAAKLCASILNIW